MDISIVTKEADAEDGGEWVPLPNSHLLDHGLIPPISKKRLNTVQQLGEVKSK